MDTYYAKNKERLREKARNRYRNLTTEEKRLKIEYGKRYYEAKKKKYLNNYNDCVAFYPCDANAILKCILESDIGQFLQEESCFRHDGEEGLIINWYNIGKTIQYCVNISKMDWVFPKNKKPKRLIFSDKISVPVFNEYSVHIIGITLSKHPPKIDCKFYEKYNGKSFNEVMSDENFKQRLKSDVESLFGNFVNSYPLKYFKNDPNCLSKFLSYKTGIKNNLGKFYCQLIN